MTATGSLQERSAAADKLWREGDAALAANDLERAWRLYTAAHDHVTDSAELHRAAHRRLRTVNQRRGARGEYLTDSVLLALAPLGVFELLALGFRARRRWSGE